MIQAHAYILSFITPIVSDLVRLLVVSSAQTQIELQFREEDENGDLQSEATRRIRRWSPFLSFFCQLHSSIRRLRLSAPAN